MAVTLSTTARDAACNAIVDLVDAGLAAGNLIFYLANGTTEVATCPLNDPGFGASATGVATLDVTPAVEDTSATGNASAATVAIFKDSDANEAFRCSVGVGTGDIDLTNNVIAAGETVSITSLTLTVPAS